MDLIHALSNIIKYQAYLFANFFANFSSSEHAWKIKCVCLFSKKSQSPCQLVPLWL